LVELTTKNAGSCADLVRDELEAMRRRTVPFDRRIKDLQQAIDDVKAKERAGNGIKGRMNGVFQGMTGMFEDDAQGRRWPAGSRVYSGTRDNRYSQVSPRMG
jgi:hypothetical protein